MKRLNYSIQIHAPSEKVWNVLFTHENYHKWAYIFAEDANVETHWNEGSEAIFTAKDKSSMYSKIEKKKPNQLMVFKHLGMIEEGKKVPFEKGGEWENARESYELVEENDNTLLKVTMDSTEDVVSYFDETFPEALKKIKYLSES